MKIIVTEAESDRVHELEATRGWRVMEIIRDAGVPIRAECGGACACATCHVYVDPDWIDKVPAKSDEEEEMLDFSTVVEDNSRLSCQIVFEPELDGLKVKIAPDAI